MPRYRMKHPAPRVVSLLLALAVSAAVQAQTTTKPDAARAFEPFQTKVKVRYDARWLYIESDGMPDHEMMTGITAWQQQVPLPQPYTGDNAWQVPLKPVPAAKPMSAKTGFFRGAIAIAVNGVPIFNPIKNDGKTDTFLAGELDIFGGHSGRADDYHYHIAPVFLNGGDPSKPVAYALDGYPIYGYTEPDGKPVRKLDELNGHDDPKLGYHYHATKDYPYLNGGFHGEVAEEGGQVDPQPHAHGVREATAPLRGARITGFERSKDSKKFTLTYDLRGKTGKVQYELLAEGAVHFVFTNPDGTVREETYRGDERRGGEGGGRKDNGGPEGQGGAGGPGGRNEGGRGGGGGGNRGRAQGGGQGGGGQGGGGQGGGRQRGGEGQPQRPQTPPGGDPDPALRKPWLAAHLPEMDTDNDKVLTQAEVTAECATTLQGYDQNGDGKVSASERDTPGAGRSAMGGFVKQHWSEVDADGDGVVSAEEIRATAQSMFRKADRDGDGRLTEAELNARQPQPGGRGGRRDAEPPPATKAAVTTPSAPVVDAQSFQLVLGRPTDTAVTANVLATRDVVLLVEYGADEKALSQRTSEVTVRAGQPIEIELSKLTPDTQHHYRVRFRGPSEPEFRTGPSASFTTQRAKGKTFVFGVQGDSHPERASKMFDADLYRATMRLVSQQAPEFYVLLGDDFSVDRLIQNQQLTQANVDAVYAGQRAYLAQVGRTAPLFLVNGNHEEAGGWFLDGTPNNSAVMSGLARTTYFSLPANDGFYSADRTVVEHVGLLRDYYAWTWGDALFVVMDNYWHSPVQVDHDTGAQRDARQERNRDLWQVSIGDAQYRWLAETLARSDAAYKFVFAHHVLGTGRGGVELADQYEWGGKDRRGNDQFAEKRPGWEMPIHQLFVKHGVSVFFQGHDHLFAHQEKDGVVYQETPNPADPTYEAFNREAYRSGTVLPNSGYLRVTVAPTEARVDYVRSFLPKDETADQKHGAVAHSYAVKPRSKSGK